MGRIVCIPISVWNKLGISLPKGAVVYEPVSANLPTQEQPHTAPSPVDQLRAERFSQIWSKYPRPIGKKQALKHFMASVKTEQDWSDINTALDNYKKTMPSDMQYVKHGSSWFCNWQDYLTIVNTTQPSNFVKSL